MSLLKHSRPAGVAALLALGLAAAGPAFARTGLQSEHDQFPLQTAQTLSSDSESDAMASFDHGENGDNHDSARAAASHDHGDHGHGGGHGGGRGR